MVPASQRPGVISVEARTGPDGAPAGRSRPRHVKVVREAGLLQGVLENAPMGLGLLDGDLRVRHMNRALGAMSDRALSAEGGMPLWDVIPDLRAALEPRPEQVLTGGRAVPKVDVRTESNPRPDQVREFEVTFYPLLTSLARGRQRGAGMVVTDVTSRNRGERRLRERTRVG